MSKGGTEKLIEMSIKKWLVKSGGICKKMHSGQILKVIGGKKYRINLESKGTTDLVAEINGMTVWIEVKKDKEQYDEWIKFEKRYISGEELPKSAHREEAQIKEKYYILDRMGKHILTYSLQDFINKLNNYYK